MCCRWFLRLFWLLLCTQLATMARGFPTIRRPRSRRSFTATSPRGWWTVVRPLWTGSDGDRLLPEYWISSISSVSLSAARVPARSRTQKSSSWATSASCATGSPGEAGVSLAAPRVLLGFVRRGSHVSDRAIQRNHRLSRHGSPYPRVARLVGPAPRCPRRSGCRAARSARPLVARCCSTPQAAAVARRLLGARRGSLSETAGAAGT